VLHTFFTYAQPPLEIIAPGGFADTILIEEIRFQSPVQNFPLLGLRISFEKLGLIVPKNPACDS
jgi:hypothetical protein